VYIDFLIAYSSSLQLGLFYSLGQFVVHWMMQMQLCIFVTIHSIDYMLNSMEHLKKGPFIINYISVFGGKKR